MPGAMDLAKRAERSIKRGLFGLLLGRRAADDGTVDLARVRRVLVVRANFRMGNLLLVTPALAALRRALPRARIDVIAPRACADLLAHSPDVDECIAVDRRTLTAPWSLYRLVRRLRAARYDLALDGGRGSSCSARSWSASREAAGASPRPAAATRRCSTSSCPSMPR